ncbi:beta-taxilin isoform X2 [Salarias fasciatus]|uniref:beta-taxilin isoform X2 n=1 Tax=Salarias fasciatus TaxID=181472 RepID=UPI001176E884|nr:beta-taxilin isoform X2 [Salarias fasciatus]
MEKAAKVLAPPQMDKVSPSLSSEANEGEAATGAGSTSPSNAFDTLEAFGRRLDEIIRTHGSAAGLMDKQGATEAEMEKMKEEPKADVKVSAGKDISVIMQSLNKLSSPEEKLEGLVKKYTELASSQRSEEQKMSVLQQRMAVLLEERQQLHAERRSSIAARCKLETLCKELQSHYSMLREETLQRCKEEEEKRSEITSHFQSMLKEIQAQIEQHSARNDKLCRENANLTDKLESLMSQCESREESLEKINKHRDLQHKLTEAKLQQANALLAEAEEKHKREKEYLLVQAAEWKLQAQTLREQGTVMQAQLTLYAQKFDEFQDTLAKSNEIYIRFKKDMDNMSEKMKKVEKESNVWKTRFENCNKALTDMIEERTEKGKEYELFVLKIQKLEKLCRALQEERKGLYGKIKEVRLSNSAIPSKILSASNLDENLDFSSNDKSALLTPKEIQAMQDEDEVLTEDMSRLRTEQTKLQEFADSLLASPFDNEDEEEEIDLVEDVVASAFVQFTSKPQVKKDLDPVPEHPAEPDSLQAVQEAQKETESSPELPTDMSHQVQKPEENQTVAEVREVQEVQPVEERQSTASAPTPEPERRTEQNQSTEPLPPPAAEQVNPPTNPQAAKEIVEETGEVKPVEDEKPQQQPAKETPEAPVLAPPTRQQPAKETPEAPVSVPLTPNTPKAAAASSSNHDASKKQAPKKKKKRGGKSAS